MGLIVERYGLNVGIEGELYYNNVAEYTTIFVEKVSPGIYSCYRLSWKRGDNKKSLRGVQNDKMYIERGTALMCFEKAKRVISWYMDLDKKEAGGVNG